VADNREKEPPTPGADVELGIANALKFRASASEATIARFLPVDRDALAKLRDSLIKDVGKGLRKKVKMGDLENLNPLERMLINEALGDFVQREVGRLQNRLDMQEAIEEAAEHASLKALPESATESQDFAGRFWEDAGEVSQNEVRRLYAAAAIKELQKPNSVSVNTLSVLRRLDSKTVIAFETATRFVCSGVLLLPSEPESSSELAQEFTRQGLTDHALQHLSSVGLFHPPTMWHTYPWQVEADNYQFWRCGRSGIRVRVTNTGPAGFEVFHNGMVPTSAAKEIWSTIVPQPQPETLIITRAILSDLAEASWLKIESAPEESIDEGATWTKMEGVWQQG